LSTLIDVIARRMTDAGGIWREEIKLERSERTVALVCRGSTMPDPEHARPGHVVVFDDVTLLDQAQRQAAWAELARRLAHEIKNPLTPIRLAAERLQIKLDGVLDADQSRLLQRATGTIIHQVDALRNMVDAFGDYARPGSSRREPLDLDALIGSVVELWSAGDSGVSFKLRLDHGDRMPMGDPGQFQQILNNLVQNAREAHPEGRPAMRIRTTIVSGNDPTDDRDDDRNNDRNDNRGDDHDDNRAWLRLDVDDNGPGFDPAMLARVFEPYVSSKPRGTGLGLAIVQRMVDLMGGRIEAGNSDAGGARVRIELPLPDTDTDTHFDANRESSN